MKTRPLDARGEDMRQRPKVERQGLVDPARARQLWGEPDRSGRYLVAVVEHGDDASEEDYSRVGNRLLGAIHNAAKDYGYTYHPAGSHKYVRFIPDEYANPLGAELADGTIIVAKSASKRGHGWAQTTRKPSPQESARWAGLPVPPEPPPAPVSLIDAVWNRMGEQHRSLFTTDTGKEFHLLRHGHYLWTVPKSGGRRVSLNRADVFGALTVWPVSGSSVLRRQSGISSAAQIWAILADDRVLGQRDPVTGENDFAFFGVDPKEAAPNWLLGESGRRPTLGSLLEPAPENWSRPVDRDIWDALHKALRDDSLPPDPTKVELAVRQGFIDIVGTDPFDPIAPTEKWVVAIHGDESKAGCVSVRAWRDDVIPLLVGRAITRA